MTHPLDREITEAGVRAATQHHIAGPERAVLAMTFASMPYGGIAHFREVHTLADVMHNLNALRKVLEATGAHNLRRDEELYRYRTWHAAVKGIAETMPTVDEVPSPDPAGV